MPALRRLRCACPFRQRLTRLTIEDRLCFRFSGFESGIESTSIPRKTHERRRPISSHEYCSWRVVCKPLSRTFSFWCLGFVVFCFALWIGLSASNASVPANVPSVTFQRCSTVYLETEGNLRQRQVEFLNRIRKADPQHQTIERAVFNEQNELGLASLQSQCRDGQNSCAAGVTPHAHDRVQTM